jgi:hypothetical protein
LQNPIAQTWIREGWEGVEVDDVAVVESKAVGLFALGVNADGVVGIAPVVGEERELIEDFAFGVLDPILVTLES